MLIGNSLSTSAIPNSAVLAMSSWSITTTGWAPVNSEVAIRDPVTTTSSTSSSASS